MRVVRGAAKCAPAAHMPPSVDPICLRGSRALSALSLFNYGGVRSGVRCDVVVCSERSEALRREKTGVCPIGVG